MGEYHLVPGISPVAPILAFISKWPHSLFLSIMGSSPFPPSLPMALALLFVFFQLLTFSLSDLERYFRGLGPPPEFQVTLNFLEDDPDPSYTPHSPISVQVSPGQGDNSCLCREEVQEKGPGVGRGSGRPAVFVMPSSHLFRHRWSRPLLGIYWQSVRRTRQPL